MKRDKLLAGLIAWLLSFCIAMGGIGCMVSGFLLEPERMATVALWCGICTAVCCICFSVRRGIPVLLGLLALFGSFLYREGSLLLQVESLLNKISKVYDMAYDCGTIRWSGMYLGDIPVDMGLTLIACVCGGVAAYPLCRGKNAIFPMVICTLPLFSCMVVTDSVPGEGWLFLLLLGLLMVVVTHTLRRRSRADGIRITALLLVPVLLAVSLIFSMIPQDDYGAQMNGVQQNILSWFQSLPFIVETPDGQLTISFDGIAEDEMNLVGVGPKTQLHYAVMDVTAEESGTMYLRGQSFDTYDGLSWKASTDVLSQSVGWPDDDMLESVGTVTISVRAARDFRYMPYYIFGQFWRHRFLRGKLTNPSMEKEYSFVRMKLSEKESQTQDQTGATPIQPRSEVDENMRIFLQLPAKTYAGALEILEDLDIYRDGISTKEIAETIAKKVEKSATYSLNTPKMPGSESDFALWFLNNSDTGYCVHFASAATVLLRAYGIPARFVTGYTCETVANSRVTVTADKAHAWVEYYDAEKGWMVLDPTPGGGTGTGSGPADPDVEITRPTRPAVTPTYPVNDTTGPAETTQPPETTGETEPVETTKPSTGATEPSGGGTGIGGDGTGTGSGKQFWSVIKPLLIGLAWIAGAAGVLWGQYLLRRNYRRKQMHTGHHNKRALARWREVLRMAKILHSTPPDALETLSEKAAFSQHTLTVEELMEFDTWLNYERMSFAERHWLFRLLNKLIWAVE